VNINPITEYNEELSLEIMLMGIVREICVHSLKMPSTGAHAAIN